MKQRLMLLIFCVLIMPTAVGCETGMIRASALDRTLNPVMDRHDKYVEADQTLTPEERRLQLRSTVLLRRLIQEAKGPASE